MRLIYIQESDYASAVSSYTTLPATIVSNTFPRNVRPSNGVAFPMEDEISGIHLEFAVEVHDSDIGTITGIQTACESENTPRVCRPRA